MDVLIISSGFVLRAIAGVVVIKAEMLNWLIICTIFLALFLALCKRRYELVLLGENSKHHRVSLLEYSPYLLDQMVTVTAASTVISYALYTTGAETIARFGTRNLVLTIPFVIYGIFRCLYLVYKKHMGGNPETVLLKDRPIVLNLIIYMLTVLIVFYT